MHAMSDATQLIGRERESRRLDELLDDIERRGAAALVVGEPGIGKSALVSAMAASAETAGLTVLRAGGAPSETWLPFAGLHQLLAPRAEAAEALPPAQREAIGGALGLSNVGTISDRPVEDRYAVSLAALNLLRDLSEYTPLLVVVEDLHWLDPMSRGVLAFVARRISTDRIVVVGTLREDLRACSTTRRSRRSNSVDSTPSTRRVSSPTMHRRSIRRCTTVCSSRPPATRSR